jgi:lactate dehydrogenase-like 2-hydroxyacid dehydrogenase
MGQDIQGSTVGIVGFGGIGQVIAKRLIPFEVKQIIYSGHSPKPQGKPKEAMRIQLYIKHHLQTSEKSNTILILCLSNRMDYHFLVKVYRGYVYFCLKLVIYLPLSWSISGCEKDKPGFRTE